MNPNDISDAALAGCAIGIGAMLISPAFLMGAKFKTSIATIAGGFSLFLASTVAKQHYVPSYEQCMQAADVETPKCVRAIAKHDQSIRSKLAL